MKLKLAMLCGLVLAAANASACYTVFDKTNRVIYQGEQPPVDMSLPLHQTLGRQHPGAQMVFDQSASCSPVAFSARAATPEVAPNTIRMERTRAAQRSTAPLLTDRRTAASLNLPHKVVEGEIVVVAAQDAARVDLPSMTVVPGTEIARAPATSVLGAGPNTAMMGAGPNTATMGAGRATPRATRTPEGLPISADGTVVITEMHNPPLVAVHRLSR